MAQTRNCPFSSADDRTCEQSDCRLWVTYIPYANSGSVGECSIRLQAIMGLPRFGGRLEEDVD